MPFNNLPDPVRIFLSFAAWGLILWFLTLGHPSLVPVAKFFFLVLVIPHGIAEWLRVKNIIPGPHILKARLALIVGAGLLWYFIYR